MARLKLAAVVAAALAIGAVAAVAAIPSAGTVAEAIGTDLGPAAGAALDRRRAVAVAELTTRCMAARGITYRAVPEPPVVVPDAELGPVEWATRWGFGLSTAVDTDGPAPAAPPPTDAGPSAVRLAATTEAARDRITGELYGRAGTIGCQPWANDTVYGLVDRLLSPLQADLAALAAAERAAPIVMAATAARHACLAGAGLGGPPGEKDAATTVDRFAARLRRLVGGPGPPDLRALTALRDEERRVATAMARCEVRFVADTAGVVEALEREFVRRHAAALERVRHALAAEWARLPPDPGVATP